MNSLFLLPTSTSKAETSRRAMWVWLRVKQILEMSPDENITIAVSGGVSDESELDRTKYASEAEQIVGEFFPNRLQNHPNVRLIVDPTATNTQANIRFLEGVLRVWVDTQDGTKWEYDSKVIVSTKTHIGRIQTLIDEILKGQKVQVQSYESILENYSPRSRNYISKVKWSPEYLKQEIFETLWFYVYDNPLGRKYIIPLVWKVLKLLKLR